MDLAELFQLPEKILRMEIKKSDWKPVRCFDQRKLCSPVRTFEFYFFNVRWRDVSFVNTPFHKKRIESQFPTSDAKREMDE